MELGPVATGYQIAIWLIIGLCLLNGSRANRFIASAMAVSAVYAIAATWYSIQPIMGLGLTLSAVLAFCGQSWRSLALCLLYAIRLVLFGIGAAGLFAPQMIWEFNFVFLTVQMLIALWSGIDGMKAKSQIFFRNLSKATNFSR